MVDGFGNSDNARQRMTLISDLWTICKICFILSHIQKLKKMILVWN